MQKLVHVSSSLETLSCIFFVYLYGLPSREIMYFRALCCAPLQRYRATCMLCTITLHCAPHTCVLHHGAQGRPKFFRNCVMGQGQNLRSSGRPSTNFLHVVGNDRTRLCWVQQKWKKVHHYTSTVFDYVYNPCFDRLCTCGRSFYFTLLHVIFQYRI